MTLSLGTPAPQLWIRYLDMSVFLRGARFRVLGTPPLGRVIIARVGRPDPLHAVYMRDIKAEVAEKFDPDILLWTYKFLLKPSNPGKEIKYPNKSEMIDSVLISHQLTSKED
jgi:hypothetical protein